MLVLIFVVILGCIRNVPSMPTLLASLYIQIPASSIVLVANVGLTILIPLYCFAIYSQIKSKSSWQALALLAPIIVVQLGRLTWQNPGLIPPLYLYWLGFIMACCTGIIFRSTLSSLLINHENTKEDTRQGRKISFSQFILGCILAASGLVYFYRLTELPLELNSFGTQAISTANRLLHREVSWWDLIFFREMTQEECGNSLPYVLWHALFQSLFGGMSIVAARSACATASLLSCFFMFRVCRELVDKNFALVTTAIYAFLPLTIHNAKFDGIFGFSSLLILIIAERLLAFCKRPSIPQGILLGLTMPLGAYGIANIRLMIIGMIFSCFYLFIITRLRAWRLYIIPSAVALITVSVLVLPQFEDISLVRRQVRGRGEHIFGGVLTQMVHMQKGKTTRLEKALEITYENIGKLGNTLTPTYHEAMSGLPHAMAPLFIVGLGLLISQVRKPAAMFILILLLSSYAAPLIAIPIYENRLLMFNISQAFVISYMLQTISTCFRSYGGKLANTLALCSLLFFSITAVLPVTTHFFRSYNPLAEIRDKIIEDNSQKIAYICTEPQTAGNFLRWNPPFLGRDSSATHPVVIFRSENTADIQALVEFLDVSGIVTCHDSAREPQNLSNLWQSEKAPKPFWWKSFQGVENSNFFVHAIDTKVLTASDKVATYVLNYYSPRLFVRPIGHEGIHLKFSSPVRYSRFAILARGSHSKAIPISLNIDGQGLEPHLTKTSNQSIRPLWFSGHDLPMGEHTISVNSAQDVDFWDKVLEDIIIIGIPLRAVSGEGSHPQKG